MRRRGFGDRGEGALRKGGGSWGRGNDIGGNLAGGGPTNGSRGAYTQGKLFCCIGGSSKLPCVQGASARATTGAVCVGLTADAKYPSSSLQLVKLPYTLARCCVQRSSARLRHPQHHTSYAPRALTCVSPLRQELDTRRGSILPYPESCFIFMVFKHVDGPSPDGCDAHVTQRTPRLVLP